MFSWMPDKDHPLWKTLQMLISLIGILVTVLHGLEGGHHGAVDVGDATGAVGGMLALKLGVQALRK